MYLLDTNAVSEPRRRQPDPGYLAWIAEQGSADLYASALTLGELRRGALLLAPGKRRDDLQGWADAMIRLFADRVLAVDAGVASVWAEVSARHRRAGRVVGLIDELIASTALAHGLTVVTRNVADFEHSGCKVLSPWST